MLEDEYFNLSFESVKWKVQYTGEERTELEQRGEDRKMAYWVGWLKYGGWGGYTQDNAGAYVWISRAAAAGHFLATYWKGIFLLHGDGVTQDQEAALRCFEEAGAGGLAFACHRAALIHEKAKRFFHAALWYQRAVALGEEESKRDLEKLKGNRPMEICPWGVWLPNRDYHSLVPEEVRDAVKTSMLLFKRLNISKYIAREVAAYVVTRSGWDKK